MQFTGLSLLLCFDWSTLVGYSRGLRRQHPKTRVALFVHDWWIMLRQRHNIAWVSPEWRLDIAIRYIAQPYRSADNANSYCSWLGNNVVQPTVNTPHRRDTRHCVGLRWDQITFNFQKRKFIHFARLGDQWAMKKLRWWCGGRGETNQRALKSGMVRGNECVGYGDRGEMLTWWSDTCFHSWHRDQLVVCFNL